MNPPRAFSVVIVGAGFGGALTAMVVRRLGLSCALVERGRHPRFAIGESTTPLTNLLLEELAADYDLPALRPLCKWGAWQRAVPHLACGRKRGFTFYQHHLDQPFAPDPGRERQLLVGASPNNELADTHWYRPEFDQYLVQQARALGVEYWDEVADLQITGAADGGRGYDFHGRRADGPLALHADLVIDATGPRGFLARAWQLPAAPLPGLPPTQALFAHFTGVGPLSAAFGPDRPGLPYPPLEAAVHHVFPGGWIWQLTFNNGITSAGVAATDSVAESLGLREGAAGWARLLDRLPTVAEMFAGARAVTPFVHQPRLAYQCTTAAGPGWALLPSAAGVVDPLLSTGFPLTLLGISRLGRLLREFGVGPQRDAALAGYARLTRSELQSTARLVGALYAAMDRFPMFKDLTRLYFAAAAFSESARRLGRPQLAGGFLLGAQPDFRAALAEICAAVTDPAAAVPPAELSRRVRAAIAPYDVAGLTEADRDPWYPALAADLLAAAPKLGATRSDMVAMLARCGFTAE